MSLFKKTKEVKNQIEMPPDWINGFNAGYAMAQSLGRPVKTEDFPKDFPKDFRHRGGLYWNGYAEGVISGGMFIR